MNQHPTDEPMTWEQRKKLNASLGDLAKQVKWSVNGTLRFMSQPDWRRFIAAHVRRQPMCPSIEGDFMVVLSVSTKDFNKQEASFAIDLIQHLGDSRTPPVSWTDPDFISQMKQHETIT